MSHYSPDKPAPNPRRWKRLAIIIALVITIIGLALGLGLGIGLRKSDDDDDEDDSGNVPERTEKWEPEVGASWQIILRSPIDLSDPDALTPDVDVYDLDLYDNDAEVFTELRRMGKRVICYFSAGSYEDYRPDSDDFDEDDMGGELDGWPGERWLKLSSPRVRDIMAKRIKLASDKGCDAIDPDNVDGFVSPFPTKTLLSIPPANPIFPRTQQNEENDLGLTTEDSTSFVKFLSAEAAKYKMAVGLKNAGDIIPDVLSVIDFSVNEQCAQYDECETFAAFIDDGKPVFQIEYPRGAPNDLKSDAADKSCDAKGAGDFSTVLKAMELDGWVQYCDGKSYKTEVDK